MAKGKPLYKVGTAFRITVRQSTDPDYAYEIDRQPLRGLTKDLDSLIKGGIYVTAFPDWPAISLYSESRWDVLREHLASLPNMNPEARYLQRKMLGHATPCDEREPLSISGPLAAFAGLSKDVIVIIFSNDNAELWTEQNLAELAGSAAEQD